MSRNEGAHALILPCPRIRRYLTHGFAGTLPTDSQASTVVVCRITHLGFVLLDPGEQERRVTSWGRVLATVCRSGRGHRNLGKVAHRLRPPRRPLGQRMATLAGVSGVLVTSAAVHRYPAVVLADLHPNALRPSPKGEDRTDRGRLPNRRIPRRAPARSRPHRRPRHPPPHRTHRYLRTKRGRTRAAVATIEQAGIQASCEPHLLIGQQGAAFTTAALPLCRRV